MEERKIVHAWDLRHICEISHTPNVCFFMQLLALIFKCHKKELNVTKNFLTFGSSQHVEGFLVGLDVTFNENQEYTCKKICYMRCGDASRSKSDESTLLQPKTVEKMRVHMKIKRASLGEGVVYVGLIRFMSVKAFWEVFYFNCFSSSFRVLVRYIFLV